MVDWNDRRDYDGFKWGLYDSQNLRKVVKEVKETAKRVTVSHGGSAHSGYLTHNENGELSILHNKRSKNGTLIDPSSIESITSSRKNRGGEKEKYL